MNKFERLNTMTEMELYRECLKHNPTNKSYDIIAQISGEMDIFIITKLTNKSSNIYKFICHFTFKEHALVCEGPTLFMCVMKAFVIWSETK